jgi:dTDP-4-amino-4,6-dideoxygalactose transaminase
MAAARRRLRLAPSGDTVGPAAWARIVTHSTSGERLAHRLALRLGAERVWLLRSGREAMRRGLLHAAERTGRAEALIPAYSCFSVPAAAVAAGLRVRLVDVDAEGRIDLASLAEAELDDVAAVVVCNLFGRAEPIDEIAKRARDAGAFVVDDAAQAFGAIGPAPDGAAADAAHPVSTGRVAGARSELGVLSFGRGKPLSGLGGGALVFGPGVEPAGEPPGEVRPAPRKAAARACAFDLALRPAVFSLLASIPRLGIGETPFEPGFERGPIDGASLVLADFALGDVAAAAERRVRHATRLAEGLRRRTRFEPITGAPGEHAVYPRLAVRAPDESARSAALAVLERHGAGVSRFYPSALSRLEPLGSSLVGGAAMPGAESLAGRLFTLPAHGGLTGERWNAALEELSRI